MVDLCQKQKLISITAFVPLKFNREVYFLRPLSFLPSLCCVCIPNSCNVIHFNTNKSENAAFFDSGEMAFKYTCGVLLLSVFLLSTKAKQLRNSPSHPAKGIALMTIDNFSHFYSDFNSN